MDGKANKRLGQHFLVSKPYCEKIVHWADIRPGDSVLEIGPGRGALTDILLQTGCRLTAVEIDRRWVEELQARYDGHSDFRMIPADFLAMDTDLLLAGTSGTSTWKVISNLPYNQATAILQKLAVNRRRLDSVTVMVQKEVGERLLARPHSRDIGMITHLLGCHFSIKKGFFVPPGAFLPPPKVTSLVIQMHPHRRDIDPDQEKSFRRLLEAAFSERRKQLHKNLRPLGFPETLLQNLFRQRGLRPDVRAEDLSTEDFLYLAEELSAGRQGSQKSFLRE